MNLNQILNWINFERNSNIELNQFGYRTGLGQLHPDLFFWRLISVFKVLDFSNVLILYSWQKKYRFLLHFIAKKLYFLNPILLGVFLGIFFQNHVAPQKKDYPVYFFNRLSGSRYQVFGPRNQVFGSRNQVFGLRNQVLGSRYQVFGQDWGAGRRVKPILAMLGAFVSATPS